MSDEHSEGQQQPDQPLEAMEAALLDETDLENESEPQQDLEQVSLEQMGVVEVAPAELAYAEPEAQPKLEPMPESELQIPVATPAPLVSQPQPPDDPFQAGAAKELLGLPLQFVNQLLKKIGATKLDSLADLIPAARLVAIALLASVALKITGASLEAINDIPLVGGLLELLGLVSLLNFLARNALKAQKRTELLSRIRKLKQDFLG